MGMQSFTFVAPGAMSPVPKLDAEETPVVQRGGGSAAVTITPGPGVLVNGSSQPQTGTSFTIEAVYV